MLTKLKNHPDVSEKYLANLATARGDHILPGFILNLSQVWWRSHLPKEWKAIVILPPL
ncbi:hypothetical protein GS682_21970 [Nostoc sp. B(2019)]|nr:hypothetical protein [Nostoc sp. B(2019)]